MWFDLILAAALMVLYVAFWAWHSQGAGKLTQAEIDQYLAIIEKLPLPEKEVQAFTARVRPWAEADDGKPVYMFNLIHFFPRVQTFPGAPDFKGTPEQANAHYERSLIWLWLSHASYPMFIGAPQASEPGQHGAGENLGQYDCRALSQPAHIFETDFPPHLCAPGALQIHSRRA